MYNIVGIISFLIIAIIIICIDLDIKYKVGLITILALAGFAFHSFMIPEKKKVEPFNDDQYVSHYGQDNTIDQYGQFYVDCPKCGRARVIQEKDNLHKTGDIYGNPTFCLHGCKDGINNDTVSVYNDKYIDKDQVFCYGCPLDNETKAFYRNYMNFPYDNGPPGTGTYINEH